MISHRIWITDYKTGLNPAAMSWLEWEDEAEEKVRDCEILELSHIIKVESVNQLR